MTLESFHTYVHTLPSVTEDFPFGPEVLVFRVGNKMFALMSIQDHPLKVNLKCDPERAVELRARYDDIIPGYHMNKQHWNTVGLAGDVPTKLIKELVDDSYWLIRNSLPAKKRAELDA